MFHFQILHTPSHKNVVADALSHRPQVNAITTTYHEDCASIPMLYAKDEYFKTIWAKLHAGKSISPHTLKDGFLHHQQSICVVQSLHTKVMYEAHAPPYVGHRGILPTTLALECSFFLAYITY